MFTVCAALQVKHTTCKLLQTVTSFKFSLFMLWSWHHLFFVVVVVGNTMLAFCGWICWCVVLIFLEFQNSQKNFFFRISQFFSESWFVNVYSALGSGKLRRNVFHSWLFVKTAMKTGKFHWNIHIVQFN